MNLYSDFPSADTLIHLLIYGLITSLFGIIVKHMVCGLAGIKAGLSVVCLHQLKCSCKHTLQNLLMYRINTSLSFMLLNDAWSQ